MRFTILALSALAAAGLGMAVPARADHYSRNGCYGGRYGERSRLREILRDRGIDIVERARLAEREGEISRRDAGHIYRDVGRVRDFLRDDRHLTQNEFDRRMRDLDDADRDFRSALRHRGRRD